MPYKDKEKQKEASRRHYQANKTDYVARATTRTNTRRDIVRKMKEENPCVDCERHYPFYVMQYDHIGDDKIMSINVLIKRASLVKVLAEIAKCDLVCANCHAERTWQRMQDKT